MVVLSVRTADPTLLVATVQCHDYFVLAGFQTVNA